MNDMAGDWIKVQHVTPDKPEVWQIADRLGIDPDAVVGKLIRVWIWADQQTTGGTCNAPSVTKALLDRVAGVTQFCAAMIDAGWLEETETGIEFRNFDRHNGTSAKKRAQGSNRAAASRNRNANVTQEALQKRDQRREEKRRDSISAAAEVHIPDKMNNDQCKAALERWCDYLDEKGWWESSPRQNDIQLEAFWQRAARMGADGFCEAVELAIASGWKNLQPARGASSKRKPESQDAWTRVNAICLEHRADAAERERLLGDDFETFRACGGFSRWSAGNTFERSAMAADFLALKGAAK